MRRWWVATEGIRFIMCCWLVCAVGSVLIITGCGGSEESEEVIERPYTNAIAAEEIEDLCEEDEGVQQIVNENYEGFTSPGYYELIVCKDGTVKPWE